MKQYWLIQILTSFIPLKLRVMIRSWISLKEYDLARQCEGNPFLDMPEETYPDSSYRLGIVEDVAETIGG